MHQSINQSSDNKHSINWPNSKIFEFEINFTTRRFIEKFSRKHS